MIFLCFQNQILTWPKSVAVSQLSRPHFFVKPESSFETGKRSFEGLILGAKFAQWDGPLFPFAHFDFLTFRPHANSLIIGIYANQKVQRYMQVALTMPFFNVRKFTRNLNENRSKPKVQMWCINIFQSLGGTISSQMYENEKKSLKVFKIYWQSIDIKKTVKKELYT